MFYDFGIDSRKWASSLFSLLSFTSLPASSHLTHCHPILYFYLCYCSENQAFFLSSFGYYSLVLFLSLYLGFLGHFCESLTMTIVTLRGEDECTMSMRTKDYIRIFLTYIMELIGVY